MIDPTRVSGDVHDIAYDEVHRFFEQRALAPAPAGAWTRALCQDHAPELAAARDAYEKRVALELLDFSADQCLLDVGCGVGRWAATAAPLIKHYTGIDFSAALLEHARVLCADLDNVDFIELAAQHVARLETQPRRFERVVFGGLLMYLNDTDAVACLRGLDRVCTSSARIYIREPMAVTTRLTLDGHWSDELQSRYSAVYRSQPEYAELLSATLGAAGFRTQVFQPAFPAELQNRAETAQQIVLLER